MGKLSYTMMSSCNSFFLGLDEIDQLAMSDSESDISMDGGEMEGGGRRRPLTEYQKFMSKNLRALRKKAESAGKNPKQTDLMVKAVALWNAKKGTKTRAKKRVTKKK